MPASLVYEALKGIRVAAEGAHKVYLAVHGDDTLSEAGRHLKASKAAHKIVARALPLADRATENLQTAIRLIQKKLAAPEADPSVRGVYLATEIRSRLSAMTASDRRKTVMQGDDVVVSAVLSGPEFLSGLTALEKEACRAAWATKKFPDELKRLQYLETLAVHLHQRSTIEK